MNSIIIFLSFFVAITVADKCPRNEEWNWVGLGDDCNDSCQSYFIKARKESVICVDALEQRCVCKKGWARTEKGNCVPTDKCPVVCSGPNERPALCGNNCNELCTNLDKICTEECAPTSPGQCTCESGYARSAQQNNECVPVKQCPKV